MDEVDLQVLPIVLGLEGAPAIFEGYGVGAPVNPLRLILLESDARHDGSLFLRFEPQKELK